MVSSNLTEEADVSVNEAPKIRVPSFERVVSLADEDSEDSEAFFNAEKKSIACGMEGRDDVMEMCFTNNPCVDYVFLSESRNKVHAEDVRQQDMAPSPDAPNEKAVDIEATGIESAVNGTSESGNEAEIVSAGDKNKEDRSYFDTLCALPYEMLVKASAQSSNVENHSKSSSHANDDIRDDDSLASTSAMGKMFDDLASLPSLASLGVTFPLMETGDDSDSFFAAVEDLALISESRSMEMPVAEPLDSRVDSVNLENAVELKLKQTIAEEEVLADEDLLSDHSYGYCKGSFPRVNSISSQTKGCVSTGLTDEQSQTERLIKKLNAAREEHGRYDIRCANITSAVADALYKDEDYREAFSMYKEALSVYSAKLGDSHVTTIDCRIHLGETLLKLGKNDAAIQEYHTVLEMRKGLNGEKDSTVADTMVMISRALRQKEGRIPQALKELKRALKIYRASLGDSDPKVSATVDDIASLYMMSGNFEKSIAILEEVVKLKAATNGTLNAGVADSVTQLAIAQQSAGDLESSLKSLKKAYSIYNDVDGEDGEKTTASLQRLARFYMEIGDYQKAINASMGVLHRQKRTLGNADRSLADTYLDLGVCLQQTGDLAKATKCLKLALTLCIGAKGKDGMQDAGTVAHVMHELGIIHQLNGRTKDAIKVFQQELIVRKKMEQGELPQAARTLFYLGTAKYDLGDHPAALSFLTEALEIYEKLEDDLGMDFAETLFSTGLVFKTTKHDEKARQAFFESLKLFYAHGLGRDHELVKMATAKLKELGHECQCQYQVCTQVPCQSIHGTIKF